MAKKKLSFNFSKGFISRENGKFVFTEVTKDDTSVYDLQATLESLIGVDGVNISISTEDVIQTVEDDEELQ